ncbi:carbohydrate sulfotransferase 3-like [Clavelina lepadiformis]|uniref:carbohydrate sulfotransferase 3-like n=1 Tax=Clavelina lepadiformis TaxID=159417 RepID=UPI004041F4FE
MKPCLSISKYRYRICLALFILGKVLAFYFVYEGVLHTLCSSHTPTKVNSAIKQEFEETISERTQTVLLLSEGTSDVDIVAEIFNQKNEVSYFYEPLYPLSDLRCNLHESLSLKILRNISKCQFTALAEAYDTAFKLTQKSDKSSRCLDFGVCFAESRNSKFYSRDAGICELGQNGEQICRKPFDLNFLSKHCSQSFLRVIKITNLCNMQWVGQLLNTSYVKTKVIHLLQDPRVTVHHRMGHGKTNLKVFRQVAGQVCKQLDTNVQYANDALSNNHWLQGRYLRVKMEEFHLDPVGMTQQIYDFIEINMNPQIQRWLFNNIPTATSDKGPTSETLHLKNNDWMPAWKEKFSGKKLFQVETICKDAVHRLGYKMFAKNLL